MPVTDTLPALDDCLDLYLRIDEHFGSTPFTAERLADLTDRADAGRPLPHLLDLLVAYGLLERQGSDRYRVRCAPDDDPDRWRTAAVSRAERLRRLVGSNASADADETLAHEGTTFASVHVDDVDDVAAVERALVDALDVAEADGVVLRSPGDSAADVQRFADCLCERGAERRDWRFEKVATDLVGAEKDDLEFRLFLRTRT